MLGKRESRRLRYSLAHAELRCDGQPTRRVRARLVRTAETSRRGSAPGYDSSGTGGPASAVFPLSKLRLRRSVCLLLKARGQVSPERLREHHGGRSAGGAQESRQLPKAGCLRAMPGSCQRRTAPLSRSRTPAATISRRTSSASRETGTRTCCATAITRRAAHAATRFSRGIPAFGDACCRDGTWVCALGVRSVAGPVTSLAG